MDSYPKNLVDQYLKASGKLKIVREAVSIRFGPKVSEDLALATEEAVINLDFLKALQHLDDIVYNICEGKNPIISPTKSQVLILVSMGVLPIRRCIGLQLPPLFDFYSEVAEYQPILTSPRRPGIYESYAYPLIVSAWYTDKRVELTLALEEFLDDFQSLPDIQIFLLYFLVCKVDNPDFKFGKLIVNIANKNEN